MRKTNGKKEDVSNRVVLSLLVITLLVSVVGFLLVLGSLEGVGSKAEVVAGRESGVVRLTIDSPPVVAPSLAGTGRVVLNIDKPN